MTLLHAAAVLLLLLLPPVGAATATIAVAGCFACLLLSYAAELAMGMQ
jgi:hypothetical protein